MSLADALGRAGGGGTSTSGHPTAISLESLAGYRAFKALVYGPFKGGKTTFAISLFEYLTAPKDQGGLGLKPEDCLIVVIDCDDGFLPLVTKGEAAPEHARIDPVWYSRIQWKLCASFDQVRDETEAWIPKLKQWQKEHGNETAWIITDNQKSIWRWTRDSYALDVYGMHEHELMAKKRSEALAKGKQTLPTFNQQFDYGAITPKYAQWAESIKLSGVNFIWLTPSDEYQEEVEGGGKRDAHKPGGQKDDVGRVDHILYLYCEAEKYYADFEGTRTGGKLFRRMPNPSLRKFMTFLQKSKEPKGA